MIPKPGWAYVEEGEGFVDGIPEKLDELMVQQFRIELTDSEDARTGRRKGFYRLGDGDETRLGRFPRVVHCERCQVM